MEESNDSCCSPQRPETSSGATRQEFSTAAFLSSTNFVSIPAGEFLMGTDETFYPTDGEGPSRSIWLDEFKISKFSVSNSEFAKFIEATGYVRMQYGFGQSSDERIKTNIKTIENALDKTLLLRGVEFNLNIEPERKRIGLIAQEVELIIPEVVRTSEDDGLKSIEYQNIVGLLVEAIKELNNKVSNLENIIKKII
jgi:hypothetical protein